MWRKARLLDLDLCARSFHLRFDLVGFFLADAFFQRARSAFDELLGVGQAETSNRAAHFLNDADLVATDFGENDVKFRLLFSRSSVTATVARTPRALPANVVQLTV